MSHRRCFEGPAEKIYSGDYISRKKARTIYKASVNLARQPTPGVYRKKTSMGGIGSNAKKKGSNQSVTYVGNVYIGSGQNTNSSGCLIGAKNYETLLSVTQGKYLSNPNTFDMRRTQSLWIYSLNQMDYSGMEVIINYPQSPIEASSINTFKYPPQMNINQQYPIDSSNNNFGLVVDYNYNIFYPENVDQSARGSCYLKNERSWKQYIKCIPLSLKDASIYFQAHNGYVGNFNYPMKFNFDCSNNWYGDNKSECLI
jgi:hypothetical protein